MIRTHEEQRQAMRSTWVSVWVNVFLASAQIAIGFVAKSIALAPEMAGKGRWVEVPKNAYEPIAQAVVVLKHGAENSTKNSQRFVDFLFTTTARKIFEKYGYSLP